MSKTLKTSILASFIGLWLTSYLTPEYQNYLGYLLIFSFGILHGANDLVLIGQFKTSRKPSFLKILAFYVSIVLISASFFVVFPFFALLFFIIISAYHFGEQHWEQILKDTPPFLKKTFQFCYGMVIFLILFEINQVEVVSIINQISSVMFPHELFLYLLASFLLVLMTLSYYIYQKSDSFRSFLVEQMLFLIVLTIIFKVSSLIWGFAIYFIFWHSLPSLNDQIQFIYGKYSMENLWKYIKTAFPYWAVSILGVGMLYFLFHTTHYFEALFFSFLASITFPHFIIILKMFQKENS
jgi:Brp/Blh family beta-carotene 15,15'-monooxygenase